MKRIDLDLFLLVKACVIGPVLSDWDVYELKIHKAAGLNAISWSLIEIDLSFEFKLF